MGAEPATSRGGPDRPVLMVVVSDRVQLEELAGDVRRRFGHDYDVRSEATPGAALERLADLAAGARPVAVVLAAGRLDGMTGIDLLLRARDVQPAARRVLLIGRGGFTSDHPAVAAMRLGHVHAYVFDPWRPLERWLYLPLTEILAGWAAETGLAAATAAAVDVVGSPWDPRSHAIRDIFTRIGLPYRFHHPTSRGARRVLEAAGEDGSRLPVVRFFTGRCLVDPSPAELTETLGFPVMGGARLTCDLAIVGAGPAGLAAAVYGASEGLRTVVVEREVPGGQAGTTSSIRNYLGFPAGITGDDLFNRAFEQAWLFGTDFVIPVEAVGLAAEGAKRVVRLAGDGEVRAGAVIVATGVSWRRLAVDGVERLVGAGVFYGASRAESRAVEGGHVHVVGAGNSAGQAALDLARHAESVTMLARGDSLGRTMSDYLVREIESTANVHVRLGTEVVDAAGRGRLEEITVRRRPAGELERIPSTAIFVMIGSEPRTAWLRDAVQLDRQGFVLAGRDVGSAGGAGPGWPLERPPLLFETSMPGVFAAGDVRAGAVKRVASAAGGGAIAVQLVHEYLAERRT
jgi:thioredoxin reductase (NADPH)